MKTLKKLLFVLAIPFIYLSLLGFYGFRTRSNLAKIENGINNLEFTNIEKTNQKLKNNLNRFNLLVSPFKNFQFFYKYTKILNLGIEGTELIEAGINFKNKSSNLYLGIIDPESQYNFESTYNSWKQSHAALKDKNLTFLKKIPDQKRLVNIQTASKRIDKQLNEYQELVEMLPQIVSEEKKYLILLQNNMEIRPTGGFMGSYSILYFKEGKLQELRFEDIYTPDGQIKGYVKPPDPIQLAFQLGSWKLRDTNWDPHFPQSSTDVKWFFTQGGEKNINGVVAINLNLAQELLEVIGPIDLPDYKESVDQNNFYRVAQFYAEHDFFPGSTQKKDFLEALGRELVRKIKQADSNSQLKIIQIIKKNLDNQEILLNFDNENLQKIVEQKNWAGKLEIDDNKRKTGKIADSFSLIEANLGVNKANCCIDRNTIHNIEVKHGRIYHTINLRLKNNNKTNPKPPKTWGGRYLSYVRFYIPQNAKMENIVFDKEAEIPSNQATIENEKTGFKSVGFFVNIPPLEEKEVVISYSLKKDENADKYQLKLYKQPGVLQSMQKIIFNPTEKTEEFNLESNKTLEFSF